MLDEATAEAGSSGARALESSAAAATKGRTVLVVVHRLTQAAAADRVIVMECGSIVESGAHVYLENEELLGGATSFVTALSVPYLIDGLVPQLAAAVDGDPATQVVRASPAPSK